MYVVLVKFCVKPEFTDVFTGMVVAQAENSLSKEPGCQRFDVAFDPDNPAACLLYEIYDNREAFDLHLETDHFKQFDQAVAGGVVSKEVSFWQLYG